MAGAASGTVLTGLYDLVWATGDVNHPPSRIELATYENPRCLTKCA